MSPIREFECSCCGTVKEVISYKEPETPLCLSCDLKMNRIEISKCIFKLRGLGWSEDGYSTDIEMAEEAWARDGKPVGEHVKGKENFYEKAETKIMDKNRKFFVSKGRAK